MKSLRQAVFTVVVVAFAASSVVAQPPGRQRADGPRPGGPNGGGPGQAILAALDADGDHEISAEEIANAATALKKLDANGDGKLSDVEVRQRPPGIQRRVEGAGERGAGERGAGERGAGRPGGDAEEREADGPPRRAGGPPSPEEFVSDAMKFDLDKDGMLNKAELAKFAEEVGPPPHGPGHDRENQPQEGRQQRPERPSRADR